MWDHLHGQTERHFQFVAGGTASPGDCQYSVSAAGMWGPWEPRTYPRLDIVDKDLCESM